MAGRTLLVLFRPAFKYAQGQDDEIPTKGSKFKLITPDFEAGKTESEAGFSNNSRTFLAPDASVFVQESFVIDVIVWKALLRHRRFQTSQIWRPVNNN